MTRGAAAARTTGAAAPGAAPRARACAARGRHPRRARTDAPAQRPSHPFRGRGGGLGGPAAAWIASMPCAAGAKRPRPAARGAPPGGALGLAPCHPRTAKGDRKCGPRHPLVNAVPSLRGARSRHNAAPPPPLYARSLAAAAVRRPRRAAAGGGASRPRVERARRASSAGFAPPIFIAGRARRLWLRCHAAALAASPSLRSSPLPLVLRISPALTRR